MLTTDLVGVLLGQCGAGYERTLSPYGSFTLSAWHSEMDWSNWFLRFLTADAGLRWYPAGKAPRGVFAAGTAGVHLTKAECLE